MGVGLAGEGGLELYDTLGAHSFSHESRNADELGLTVWNNPDQDRHDRQQGGKERDPAVMLHLHLCPHPLSVKGGPGE